MSDHQPHDEPTQVDTPVADPTMAMPAADGGLPPTDEPPLLPLWQSPDDGAALFDCNFSVGNYRVRVRHFAELPEDVGPKRRGMDVIPCDGGGVVLIEAERK